MASPTLIAAAAPIALAIELASASPVAAQDNEAALDALVEESTSPAAGMAAARAHASGGDLAEAAATLERVLLADPNAHEARLLYAAMLCKLGDVQAARVEVAKLDRQQVTAAGWAETEAACGGVIRRPLPPSANTAAEGLSGEIYAGVAYDSDAAGAIQLQTDFGFEDDKGQDGIAAIAGGQLLWRQKGYGAHGGIYAGASLASKHDLSGPNQDYDVAQLRGGWGRSGRRSAVSVGAVVNHTRLFDDPYVTEYGGQAELILGNPEHQRVRLRAEAVSQDYKDGFPGDDADGWRFELLAALESRLGDRGQWTIGVAGEAKTADLKLLGYRGGRLFAAALLPLAGRQYVAFSGTLRFVDFRDDPPSPDRKDLRGFARAAYGVPLNSRSLFIEGAASYTYRSVSISSTSGGSVPDLETYHSPGADLRLIWKF